jgi:hypothetical protein
MSIFRLLFAAACAWLLASGIAEAETWQATEKTDVLTDARSTEYVLAGKFINVPTRGGSNSPRLVVQCAHGVGSKPGHRIASYLIVGTVLQSTEVGFRIDDGKAQPGFNWKLSNDLTSGFFDAPDLTEFLYGHMFKHKIDTSRPVHKLVIVMTEYAGGNIAMQFDMPDPSEVARACGIIK